MSFPTSTKVAAAQSELQACETHLASKESELALKRCAAVREGLSTRAKAMVECSWAWGQVGRQILGSLDDLGNGESHKNGKHPFFLLLHVPFFNYDFLVQSMVRQCHVTSGIQTLHVPPPIFHPLLLLNPLLRSTGTASNFHNLT